MSRISPPRRPLAAERMSLCVLMELEGDPMTKKRYVYWQDERFWLGYLEEFPDYWTQGETETEAELKENLLDLYRDLSSGAIPHVRRVAELEIS